MIQLNTFVPVKFPSQIHLQKLFRDKESSEEQVIHAVSLDSDTVVFTGMLLLKYMCLVIGLLTLVCFTGFDGNTCWYRFICECAFKMRTTYS